MTFTKAQFSAYLQDVKGYDELQVKEIFQQMRDFGTGMDEYLSQEDIAECYAYSN